METRNDPPSRTGAPESFGMPQGIIALAPGLPAVADAEFPANWAAPRLRKARLCRLLGLFAMSGRFILNRCVWPLPISVILMVVPPLEADPASPVVQTELHRKVARLVAELDAQKRSVRSAALESLLALGPGVLPLLPDERT